MPRDSRTVRTPALSASWSSTIRTFNGHFRFPQPEGVGCTLRESRVHNDIPQDNQVNTLMRTGRKDDLICKIVPAKPLISCANGYRASFGTTVHGEWLARGACGAWRVGEINSAPL
jgi:hypothetical protein